MSASDFFHISVGMGVLVVAVFLSMTLWRVYKTLDLVELVIEDIRNMTYDIGWMRSKVKKLVVRTLLKLLGQRKGGEWDE